MCVLWCRLEEELKAARAMTDEERKRREEAQELLEAERRKNEYLSRRIKEYALSTHIHTYTHTYIKADEAQAMRPPASHSPVVSVHGVWADM